MKTNALLFLLTLLLCVLNVMFGSVDIPAGQVLNALTGQPVEKASWQYIVIESRLPQTITALLCGASLATAGLLLQTAFRNPLAGPSILGITNGASMGVSVVLLVCGGVIGISDMSIGGLIGSMGSFHIGGFLAIVSGAFVGAMLVISMIMTLSSFIKSTTMLLIVGIMVGYLTSSLTSLMYLFASADSVHNFSMWGMGSFSDVTLAQLPWFAGGCVVSLALAVMLIKPLNALLLGDYYATSLGIDTRKVRRHLLFSTGLLTAVATAFCGPVSFIGLAVPHIARLIIGRSNHRVLLPATILCGCVVALACNLLCILPHNIIIPVNAVTPIFGAPVIIYIILKGRR